MNFIKTTEQSSNFNDLEKMSVSELLTNINKEDQSVALAVEKVIPSIEKLVVKIVETLRYFRRLRMPSNLWCFAHYGYWLNSRR